MMTNHQACTIYNTETITPVRGSAKMAWPFPLQAWKTKNSRYVLVHFGANISPLCLTTIWVMYHHVGSRKRLDPPDSCSVLQAKCHVSAAKESFRSPKSVSLLGLVAKNRTKMTPECAWGASTSQPLHTLRLR